MSIVHKTLIDGTSYSINSGKSMISGTVYNISSGKTMIGGTVYDICINDEPTAMLYSDGNMVFQLGKNIENGRTLINSYTGFENLSSVPWESQYNNIIRVRFNTEISPINIGGWFQNTRNLRYIYNANRINMNKVTYMRSFCDNSFLRNIDYIVCGDNVQYMDYAYNNCGWIGGNPVCGNNVITMNYAYSNCWSLTGKPVCGDKVTSMISAYNACCNLTGSPVCGNNVVYMLNTYRNCPKIGSNGYFYSHNIVNAQNCFSVKNNSKRLNLYVPANSTTATTVLYNNTKSLVGANITWTNAGTYQYNITYNIYVYPVENVAAARAANGD